MDLMFAVGIAVGLFVGTPIAFLILALCWAARWGDEQSARVKRRLATDREEHYHGHNR